MGEHPTTLELELARTGEAGAEVVDHCATCAACRAEIDGLDRFARAAIATEPPTALDLPMAALAERHAARVRTELAAPKRLERARAVRIAPWIAAAAGIAVVVAAGSLWRFRAAEPARSAAKALEPARAEDVNRDGRVDVLDAFALARALEAGGGRREWDLNRDGAVDDRDVDAVALAAVALTGGGR
jgi:hypothetical protein